MMSKAVYSRTLLAHQLERLESTYACKGEGWHSELVTFDILDGVARKDASCAA